MKWLLIVMVLICQAVFADIVITAPPENINSEALYLPKLKLTKKGIPIYCPDCKKLIYYYQKSDITAKTPIVAEDFLPADKKIAQPQETDPMICPLCKAPLNGWEYWAWKSKQPAPVFMFEAISLLTKDDKDNFIWIPYDVPVEELRRKFGD